MGTGSDIGAPLLGGRPTILRSRTRRPAPRGLHRVRLVDPVLHPAAPSLTTVVAPAGCGKTTLLSHVAASTHDAVAWLTLDSALAAPADFLAHLEAACATLLPGAGSGPEPWTSLDIAISTLEDGLAGPTTLVLDEAQSVDGTAAGELVEGLVQHQPPMLRIVLGSRTASSAALTRRLAGTGALVDAEALRFRTWEVEELFRTFHGSPLRADEIAELARRTAGWATGLELFHLATQGQPASTRARLLGAAGSGPISGDYLARHVLDRVPGELRDFLVRTSVLADLTAERCDELLGGTDAAHLLDQAARLGLLGTVVDAPETTYRCQEVMRGHLLDSLPPHDGGPRARALHRRAGNIALRAGEYDEALRSYCRAHEWDSARRVLAVGGGDLAGRPGPWIDVLPGAIRDTDPWVALALARRLVGEGRLEPALDAYRLAAQRCSTTAGRALATQELHMVQTWLSPPLGAVGDWVALARAAVVSPRPLLGQGWRADGDHELARAVGLLVSGELTAAAGSFGTVAGAAGTAPLVEALALLGEALSLSLAHRGSAQESRERAAVAANLLGAPVLERLADGLDLACRPHGREALHHLADRAEALGDHWGAALISLFGAVSALSAGGPVEDCPPDRFEQLAAPALVTWCAVLRAVAAAAEGRTPGGDDLIELERSAAGVGPLPHALALLATGSVRDGDRAARLAEACGASALVRHLRRATAPWNAAPGNAAPGNSAPGNSAPGNSAPGDAAPGTARASLEISCLGGFALLRDGRPLPVDALRPQHQALLRALCLHAPRAVPRDRLVEWFWPATGVERAQHSVQVAVSEVRRLLDREAGAASSVRRGGGGYSLVLDKGDRHDVRQVEARIAEGRAALARGETLVALRHLGAAVDAYTGDLLPDDGAAEWVAPERDRLHTVVVGACETLADLWADLPDPAGAVRVARHGITLDRYRDGLWRRLLEGLVASDQPAAAAAARREYLQVLAELDLPDGAAPALRRPPELSGPVRAHGPA